MPTTAEAPERIRMTRDQAAKKITGVLTAEPQSEAAIRRRIGGNAKGGSTDVTAAALGVLEARHEAKRIQASNGDRGGWVRYDSRHEAVLANPQSVQFPYKWGILPFDEMFIDQDYQRPLTTFVKRIERLFDPVLFQTLAISDRGTKSKPRRYAIIDGQTRWVAATRIGVIEGPCIIFTGLTPEDEADIFARLQTNRRGMVSWHRFRADLKAKKPEALAIKRIVEAAKFKLGDGQGELKAVAALEAMFRIDEFLLERALADLKSAWPDEVPEAPHIRGLHFFFRHYPIENPRKTIEIDDDRLVRVLSAAGPESLKRKANAAKEASPTGKGSSERWMGQAIQNTYARGGRS